MSTLLTDRNETSAAEAADAALSSIGADAPKTMQDGAARNERREGTVGEAVRSTSLRHGQRSARLRARLEPFDSYWQAPDDVEKGYSSFYQYYKHNYLPHLPKDKAARMLVVSCGPGYLVNLLKSSGYTNIVGIDSDERKIAHARAHGLECTAARAFEYLIDRENEFDAIIPEQELNHLTLEEQLEFLALCRKSLREDGMVLVYGLNGANPLVASENLSHNIDHFNTFTEHSLHQVLELAGFEDIVIRPLSLYVFWKNPLNYVGLAFTGAAELFFRIVYKMYGKSVRVLTKKIAATAVKRTAEGQIGLAR
jgi:2-polyprenyl-3-methyl-5-hydroxy-6-metoxy-1,4-benzoquinol methylase